MALECVCFPVKSDTSKGVRNSKMMKKQGETCKPKTRPVADIDLCEIIERTQNSEQHKHNDYQCHLQGEGRQNLINKLKMYLDDYDDRPVMKRSVKEDAGKVLGQSGYGPLIKYPGYVDYQHPYFGDPHNKMPNLAMTVNQKGKNPCPPISVRNWDTTYKHDIGEQGAKGGAGVPYDGCRCAERRGVVPKCPAAYGSSVPAKKQTIGGAFGPQWGGPAAPHSSPVLVSQCQSVTSKPAAPSGGGVRYYCYPLPDN